MKRLLGLVLLTALFSGGPVHAQKLNDDQLLAALIAAVITHDVAIPVGLLPLPAVQLAAEATEFSVNLALKGFRPWLKAPPGLSRFPGADNDGDLCSYQFHLPSANAEYENLFGVIPLRQPLYDAESNRLFLWKDRWGELQSPRLYHANSSVRLSVRSLKHLRRYDPVTMEETEYYTPILDAYSPASDVPRVLRIPQPARVDRDGQPAVEGSQQVYLPIGTHTLAWTAATQLNLLTDVIVPGGLLAVGVLTEIKNVAVGLKAAKKVKQQGIGDNIVNAADNAADTRAALNAGEKFDVFWKNLIRRDPPGNIAKIVRKKAAQKLGCTAFDILVKVGKLGVTTIRSGTGAELDEAGLVTEQERRWIDAIYQVAIELKVNTSIDVLKLHFCGTDNDEFAVKVIVNLLEAFGLSPFVTTDTAISTAGQRFTVWDNVPPTISFNPEPLVLEATDFGGIRLYRVRAQLLEFAEAASSDNCGRTPELSNGAPELLLLGEREITWTARDRGPNPNDGQDYAPTAVQNILVRDTQPPLLLAPPSKVILNTADVTLAAAKIGDAVAIDLADVQPQVTNDAPAVFPVNMRTPIQWAATDASGNKAQSSQLITVKDSNTPPTANGTTASTLTAKPVDIRLTANDVDELGGRFDPLWFKIESAPEKGEFIAPLYPFFINDYRTRPNDGLGEDYDPTTDEIFSFIGKNYCDKDLAVRVPPRNFVHEARFVHVTDDGIRYVLDEFFICDPFDDKAFNKQRFSKWNPAGDYLGQMQIGSSPSDSPVGDGFRIDRDGFLYYNTLIQASTASAVLGLQKCAIDWTDSSDSSQCTESYQFTGNLQVTANKQLDAKAFSYARIDSNRNIAYVVANGIFAFELLETGGTRYLGELGPKDDQGMVLEDWFGTIPTLEVGSDGTLYANDMDWHRLHKIAPIRLDKEGGFVLGEYIGWAGKCTDSGNKACEVDPAEPDQGRSRGYSCTYEPTSCTVAANSRSGSRQGQLDTPKYISIDPNDILYVADFENERIQRFSPDGSFAGEAVSDGSGINKGDRPGFVLGNMGMPASVAVNSSQFFVVDRAEQFVHVFGTLPFKEISDDAATVTYVSDQDFHSAIDSFSFSVSDGLAVSTPATVDVTVDRNFRPPLALAAQVSTNEDTALEITLTGDDPDGVVDVDFNGLDMLAFSVTAQPRHGTLNGSGANWTYNPDSDYYGDDEIRFTVNDGLFTSDEAAVAITVIAVNDPPVLIVEASATAALGFPTLVTSTFTDDPSEDYGGELDWADGHTDTTGAIVDDEGENPRIEGVAISPPPLPDLEGRTFTVHTYETTGVKSIELCVFDSDERKGCDSAEISVEKLASLGVGATVFSAPLADGEILQTQIADDAPFKYQLTIVNDMPSVGSGVTAADVRLTGKLPVGLPIGDIEITRGTCSRTGTALDCSLGSLSPGEEVVLTVNILGQGGLVFNTDQDFEGEVTTTSPAIEAAVSFFVTTELVADSVDSDGDGMSDIFESTYGLNNSVDDSAGDKDGDGLTNLGEFLAGTDPTDADTDGDTLPDGYESDHGLNPLTALDANEDLDGDGLTNLEEFKAGTDPTDSEDTATYFKGTIRTAGDEDICALVLTSGRFMFSCNPTGVFSLVGLPREQDGTFKRQIYADGFFPKIDVLPDSVDEAVVMARSGACPQYNPPIDPGFFPDAAGQWIELSGSVEVGENGDPVCAMVLANGQFVFSCDGSGSYAMNIPLDANGQFKLQVYADGFAPTIQTFDMTRAANDVRMARAVECPAQ